MTFYVVTTVFLVLIFEAVVAAMTAAAFDMLLLCFACEGMDICDTLFSNYLMYHVSRQNKS